MQGLVNFSTAIADGIAVMLPAFCYIAACCCFLFAAWTLRSYAYPHHHHHHYWRKPWVPFVSLILAGVFASFPHFLTMANVSAGTDLTASLTSYAPTMPGNAASILGSIAGEHRHQRGHAVPALLPDVRRRLRVLGDLVAGARSSTAMSAAPRSPAACSSSSG